MPGGRPTKYKEEHALQAAKLCKLGATNKDLADFFKVSLRTIDRWSISHEEFCRALKVGKGFPDDKVERSLLQRALGYWVTERSEEVDPETGEVLKPEILREIPPDVTACIYWLKNRRPDEWRDKQENNEGTGKIADALSEIADSLKD